MSESERVRVGTDIDGETLYLGDRVISDDMYNGEIISHGNGTVTFEEPGGGTYHVRTTDRVRLCVPPKRQARYMVVREYDRRYDGEGLRPLYSGDTRYVRDTITGFRTIEEAGEYVASLPAGVQSYICMIHEVTYVHKED